jgi:putative endonuclease
VTRDAGVAPYARGIGAAWEDAAHAHLVRHGLRAVARNFSCRYGEIDLVMRERDLLVFVEVRYRGDDERGDGTASVGPGKRAKLIRTATLYLQKHPQFGALPCRFDVVGCTGTPAAPQFAWVRGAFEAV